jgi:hypothetical protein
MLCREPIHIHTTVQMLSRRTATIWHLGLYMRSIGVNGQPIIVMREK